MSRTQLKLGSIESWDVLGRMEITERLDNWVGNGCNMLEEVAPVAESGRFVSG